MANRIVLVSDDNDFFEYILTKLELRKSDELFKFGFDSLLENIHNFPTAVFILNSEANKEKTLELLKLLSGNPVIVSAYNDDDAFRRKCYRLGMFDFMTLLTPDSEFRARMIPAFTIASVLEKNKQYRDLLVKNKVIASNREVYLDYNYIIDKELEELSKNRQKAVFMAVAPNDKTKFLLKPEIIETVILNNIRKNDILMNYATNKYFLILFDSDIKSAQTVWEKISSQMPEKIYAGFSNIFNQERQQLINEVLNKLHIAINNDRTVVVSSPNPVSTLGLAGNSELSNSNFKLFKHEFGRKLDQVISPVFYQIQQKYSGKLSNAVFQQGTGEGYGTLYIKGRYASSSFRITSPGFSKINIDITYQKDASNIDAKRITLEPEELEPGLLEDLLEQFILEYKRGEDNEHT